MHIHQFCLCSVGDFANLCYTKQFLLSHLLFSIELSKTQKCFLFIIYTDPILIRTNGFHLSMSTFINRIKCTHLSWLLPISLQLIFTHSLFDVSVACFSLFCYFFSFTWNNWLTSYAAVNSEQGDFVVWTTPSGSWTWHIQRLHTGFHDFVDFGGVSVQSAQIHVISSDWWTEDPLLKEKEKNWLHHVTVSFYRDLSLSANWWIA